MTTLIIFWLVLLTSNGVVVVPTPYTTLPECLLAGKEASITSQESPSNVGYTCVRSPLRNNN